MAELLNIGYGKEAVSVYRTDGVSSLFAAEVGMTARGEAFEPSYTEGDNTLVVATDSMKNFIHMTALEFDDPSLEGFLELLARRFMDTYSQAERVELTGAKCRSRGARNSRSSASAATSAWLSSRSTATGRSSTAPAERGSS